MNKRKNVISFYRKHRIYMEISVNSNIILSFKLQIFTLFSYVHLISIITLKLYLTKMLFSYI